MSLLPIETVDTDGAIREAQEAVAGDTRADFFRKAAVGGGAVLGSSAFLAMLPELAAAKPSKKQDVEILNYALTLEYLEAEFYREAANAGTLSGDAQRIATLLARHEQDHVKAIKSVLGKAAVKKPSFNFQGTNTDPAKFLPTAFVLENTGTRAYLGQATRVKQNAVLAAAGAILAIEARHAAAIAMLLGNDPISDNRNGGISPFGSFDEASSMKKILREVTATEFITG